MPNNTLDIDSLNFESLARDILSGGNALRFRARGGSMRPLIQDGDLLEVVPVHTAEYHLGDVILFSDSGGQLMAHRLIHRFQREGHQILVMQGDANPREDYPVPASRVLGRVVSVERAHNSFRFTGSTHRLVGWFFILFAPTLKRVFHRLRRWLKPSS